MAESKPAVPSTPDDRGLPSSAYATGVWKRAIAKILDTFFLFALSYGIKAGLAIGFGASSDRPTGTTALAVYWLISLLGTLGYYILFELFAGTTIGKVLVGAQVVALDLGPIRAAQAVKRSLAVGVDGLFFGMIAAIVMSESPLKQRVGDKWAKTRVVPRKALLPALRTSPRRIAAAAIVALCCSSASTIMMVLL